MPRILAFLYGTASYAFFFVTFLYAVGFVAGIGVPRWIDSGPVIPLEEAIVIDLALLGVFAVQHSVMARKQFKAWWAQFVPRQIERSTYVLLATSALALLMWQWRPIPALVWSIENPLLAHALTGVSLLGWLLVLTSTFLINHFELFGLQQVAHNLRHKPMPEATFRTPLFYRVVRHPIYLGFVIAFWVAPQMSVGHLVFAATTTAYILIGIMLEENDLVALFGDEYRRYKARVPMLVPGLRSGGEPAPTPRSHPRRSTTPAE